jgi:trehalose 6-phosphate synthase/phosphatase
MAINRHIMKEGLSKRLIVVSNRLPFQVLESDGKIILKESDGGLVSALKSYFEDPTESQGFTEKWWIGSADFPAKRWDRYTQQRDNQDDFHVEPLFIEKKIYNSYYNGFCNATLWPLFHYFPSFVEFDEETFKSYETVNRQFADHVLKFLQPNDTLWIHDYQLMLLPGMIRAERPDCTIGFFLHIPFPSFEVFRLLHRPWKEKIIDGLLGADLIGFHTHEYVQHFLKSVQMVSGFDYQFRTVFLKDRIVKAEMFPLGIDFNKFFKPSRQNEIDVIKKTIESNFQRRRIIFSVDRLDYTKGITHRLSGFERFLELHPRWKEKVVFILVVVPSRQIISKYNERKKLIEEQIGRINGKHSTLGWQPVIYRYNNLSFQELSALYQIADVGLITPLRDGMNLVAKEFVASKHGKGVLVLSELAGAANEMGEALLVNPMDKEEVSSAIETALNMDTADQKTRLEALQKRLKEYDVLNWVNDFMKQLLDTKQMQHAQRTRYVTGSIADMILQKFMTAHTRHLFLDYDGTLVPFSKHPKLAIPGEELMSILRTLAMDPTTDVTIISGRHRDSLEEWFNDLPINLVAEHGAAIRMKNGVWKLEPEIDISWKPNIRPTLELFTQRSPGAFIEEKNHTLAWHYRNVESELGFIRSRELLDSLHHMIRNAHLQIIDGNKVIEVRVSGVDKGAVTRRLLEEKSAEFVLAVGDDKTDEDMFRALSDKAITIKIGSGHTLAQYSLANQSQVISLLQMLNKSVQEHLPTINIK